LTDEKQIQPSSIDMRLGDEFKVFKVIRKPYIDPGFEGRITLEISNIGSMPVALYPGQRVCQIVFETMTTPSELPYGHPDRNSKYMGQTRPESSRIKLDYELKKD
jgi:dCTP deaminase